MQTWYTDWLLQEIIATKNDIQFFTKLGKKHEVANEIAYSLKLEMKQLIQQLIQRKKQNEKQPLSR